MSHLAFPRLVSPSTALGLAALAALAGCSTRSGAVEPDAAAPDSAVSDAAVPDAATPDAPPRVEACGHDGDVVINYLKSPNPTADDWFGRVALSADGSTLAVGAPSGVRSDPSLSPPGAVTVFVRSGATWRQQAYLKASNPDRQDLFGFHLALSADGSTLAVSAVGEASAATGINGDQTDNSAPVSGAVYVFTRSGDTWHQQAYLKASNTDPGDDFGYSLAFSADSAVLAIGAPFEDSAATGIDGDPADNSMTGAGAVYLFARDGAAWHQTAYVKASNPGTSDGFGSRVALAADGSTLAVAAMRESSAATGVNGNQADNSAGFAGAVYVFARDAATWHQTAYVKASNTGAVDSFGHSLALSGDGSTLAVGASEESSSATGIDGDQTDNTATASGAVYLFVRDATAWSQQAYIKASNTTRYHYFGSAVALSADGSTLVGGATGEDSAAIGIDGDQTDHSAGVAGAAYRFTRTGSTWRQRAYIKASNTDEGDEFGYSLAISADGASVVAAASFEASQTPGVCGDQADNSRHGSGAVYVYEFGAAP